MEFLKIIVAINEALEVIDDKEFFEATIGSIVHKWCDDHGEDVRDVFSDLTEVSMNVVELMK